MSVTGKDDPFSLKVPQGQGPLAIEVLKTRCAPLLIGVYDDLCITLSLESMPLSAEFGGEFNIVEYFTVECDPDGVVFIG